MNKTEILQDLAERLRNKYGEEPGIFPEQSRVVLDHAAKPNAPLIPDEITRLIFETAEKFGIKENIFSFITNKGNIVITIQDK